MKKGFTLAEVLITLAIIGIVAALTIPIVVHDYQNKQLETRKKKFESNIVNTAGVMYAQGELDGTTTENFLSRFIKYQNVLKTCDSNHLADCFPEKIKIGDDEISVNNLKTPASLGLSYSNDNNVGIVLPDGASIILSYDPNCSKTTFSTGVISCMHMLVDVDGKKGENKKDKDIVLYGTLEGLMVGDLIRSGCYLSDNYVQCDGSSTPDDVFNIFHSYGMLENSGWVSAGDEIKCNCSGGCNLNTDIVKSCVYKSDSPE